MDAFSPDILLSSLASTVVARQWQGGAEVSGTAVQASALGHSSPQKPSKKKNPAFHRHFWITSRKHATDGVIGVATDQTLSTTQPPLPPHRSQVGEGHWGYSPSLRTWDILGGTQQCFVMPENCPQAASLCLLPPGSSMRIQPELSGVSITPSPSR